MASSPGPPEDRVRAESIVEVGRQNDTMGDPFIQAHVTILRLLDALDVAEDALVKFDAGTHGPDELGCSQLARDALARIRKITEGSPDA